MWRATWAGGSLSTKTKRFGSEVVRQLPTSSIYWASSRFWAEAFGQRRGALPGFESVTILSYGLWQSRFGGDRAIVGKTVRVNERELEVIGVMPPRFRFPEIDDLWVPYDPGEGTGRADRFLHAVARLREGTSMGELRAELDAIADRVALRYPETNRGWGLHALPYRELVVKPRTRLVAQSLLGAVGLVLLIGCANLASLLLARGTERQREFSLRAALGAGRGALMRQLLAESLLLGGLAEFSELSSPSGASTPS